MQYTEKDFKPIVSWLKKQDHGIKTKLAKHVGITPQQVSFYLKYKNLPKKRFDKIKDFCR